jgi:hypothetical protein
LVYEKEAAFDPTLARRTMPNRKCRFEIEAIYPSLGFSYIQLGYYK